MPESVTRQILARTMHTSPDGTQQVSDWFDLTAVDESAVEHNFFPSHTAQNMLRRAWTSYLELHGSDDRSNSERALMIQKYLRNITINRVAEHRDGAFEAGDPVAGDHPTDRGAWRCEERGRYCAGTTSRDQVSAMVGSGT